MRTTLLFAILWLALAQSSPAQVESLQGRYVSSDHEEMGVMVFRADGVFGYKAPSKHVLYSEDQLPPNRARYKVLADRRVEVFGLAQGEVPFTLELQHSGQVIVLTRAEGTMPRRAIYKKR